MDRRIQVYPGACCGGEDVTPVLPLVVLPDHMINDREFAELFPSEMEDVVIAEMVDRGWQLGRSLDGQNEFWSPLQ